MIAVLAVDVVEQIGDRATERFRVSGHFRKHQRRAIRILVAHRIRAEVAVAFLAAKNKKARILKSQQACLLFAERAVIALLLDRDRVFVFAKLRGDVLEAGERVDDANAEAISDRALKFGGDKSFDQHRAAAI